MTATIASTPECRDRLTTFLYLLMRDHLPFGTVAQLIDDLGGEADFELTAKPVGFYAQKLADRLLPGRDVNSGT